jgi:hypothetical protein
MPTPAAEVLCPRCRLTILLREVLAQAEKLAAAQHDGAEALVRHRQRRLDRLATALAETFAATQAATATVCGDESPETAAPDYTADGAVTAEQLARIRAERQ